jgi:hypothetical protein
MDTKKTQRINKTHSCFIEKINNIDKLLATVTKRRREKTQNKDKKRIL